MTKNMAKAEIFSAFFVSVFTGKTDLQEYRFPREENLEHGRITLSREGLDYGKFNRLNMLRSMAPYGMHPQMLNNLTNTTAKPLFIVFERSWRLQEVHEDGKK